MIAAVSPSGLLPLIIAEWPRNTRETIRVTLDQYQGHSTVDIRSWYSDSGGTAKPSNKGLTLGVSHLERLSDSLSLALEHARTHDLIKPSGK